MTVCAGPPCHATEWRQEVSTIPSGSERIQLLGTLPRCAICHRRLRSTPWKYLEIGPICARKNPTMTKLLRDQYQQRVIAETTDPHQAERRLETMDAELRRVGADA
jgi:hypothetical protein